MTSRDFCYWLQGYFELANKADISLEQAHMIKNHLSMVFKHEIDPAMGDEKHQGILSALHKGFKPDSQVNC